MKLNVTAQARSGRIAITLITPYRTITTISRSSSTTMQRDFDVPVTVIFESEERK